MRKKTKTRIIDDEKEEENATVVGEEGDFETHVVNQRDTGKVETRIL